ncbi:hypothetical protein [Kitasatospora sp. NPDC002040]|uniref:hypothetical protein n=1 Tax=Kitasatospora sp. NPDC002040 TaxID=3154661 RepID=UPI0033171697
MTTSAERLARYADLVERGVPSEEANEIVQREMPEPEPVQYTPVPDDGPDMPELPY